jgi:RND family efflux transporter MFP subunit
MLRFSRRHGWLTSLVSVVALSATGYSAWSVAQPTTGTLQVATAEIALRPVGSSLMFDATVEAVKQSTLAAQASGRLMSMTVKAGDPVRAGQVLATIDDRITQAGVAQAQAGVAQAQAELRDAEANLKRVQDLHRQGFVSQSALDMADLRWQGARAAVTQARAGATQSELAQGFTRLTAPYDGFVFKTHAEAGDLAAPGTPIVTIYAPKPLRAITHVPASRSRMAEQANQIEIELQRNGQPQWVQVAQTSRAQAADPLTQTVQWRLDLSPEQAENQLPGQQVRVRFLAGRDARLVVPHEAILRRGELTAVYVAQPQGFVLRAVRLGADRGESGYEVLSGIKSGDRVALDPVRASLVGAQPAAQ